MNIWRSAEKPKFRYELNMERERLGIYLECIEGEDHHDFHYFTVGLEFHILWWFRRFGFYHFWYEHVPERQLNGEFFGITMSRKTFLAHVEKNAHVQSPYRLAYERAHLFLKCY